MNKQEQINQHQKKKAEIYSGVNIDDRTNGEVMDEGLMHLVQYFEAINEPPFDRDYLFVMGKTYIGLSKNDPTKKCYFDGTYLAGSLHEWAHDLAKNMRENDRLRHMIFHAVHIFATDGR